MRAVREEKESEEKETEERERERERVREERVSRKKIKGLEKVEQSRHTVFFQCFVAPEGRKVGALKRRVRRHWQGRSKIARHCGAKHISKSKLLKHLMFGALLEIEMLKKCTPLWREAHVEATSVKH